MNLAQKIEQELWEGIGVNLGLIPQRPVCNECGNYPARTVDECTFCRGLPRPRPWTEDDARALAFHGEDD